MITTTQCDAHINECRSLGTEPNISIQRATAIMAVCRGWLALRTQVVRYHAVVEEENGLIGRCFDGD
jgi:hypothetical protein